MQKQWIDKYRSMQPTSKALSYAVYMMGSLWYYSLCVCKSQSDTPCKLIQIAATCAWTSKKTPGTCLLEKRCASPW